MTEQQIIKAFTNGIIELEEAVAILTSRFGKTKEEAMQLLDM